MGLPLVHGSAVAFVILLAACGTPESPGNPDVTPSVHVTPKEVIIHVDDGATPGGNGSGRFPYQNLPEAVAAAHAIAGVVVIKVEPGDYALAEPLVIDRSVDLQGSTEQVESDDPYTGTTTSGPLLPGPSRSTARGLSG